MIRYVKCLNRNKAMSFKVTDESYTKIWEGGRNLINMKLDSEPVYGNNDKQIKTKIKTYRDKIKSVFKDKKVPKENTSSKCLSLIMLDSVIRTNKKYYPQTLLEECKYKITRTKTKNLIKNDLIC